MHVKSGFVSHSHSFDVWLLLSPQSKSRTTCYSSLRSSLHFFGCCCCCCPLSKHSNSNGFFRFSLMFMLQELLPSPKSKSRRLISVEGNESDGRRASPNPNQAIISPSRHPSQINIKRENPEQPPGITGFLHVS